MGYVVTFSRLCTTWRSILLQLKTPRRLALIRGPGKPKVIPSLMKTTREVELCYKLVNKE